MFDDATLIYNKIDKDIIIEKEFFYSSNFLTGYIIIDYVQPIILEYKVEYNYGLFTDKFKIDFEIADDNKYFNDRYHKAIIYVKLENEYPFMESIAPILKKKILKNYFTY